MQQHLECRHPVATAPGSACQHLLANSDFLSKILLPCWISDISLTMNDQKAIATIFFRVFGVSNLIYSVLYWLYGMFTNLFEPQTRFIITTMWAFTYLALGLLLILFSTRLAAAVVKGLNNGTLQNPPLPPSFPANVQQ